MVTIIPTNLVTNSLSSLFLSFHKNKKQESNFQQVGGLVTRNSFFKVSCAILQRYIEFNRLINKDFVKCYSCSLFLLIPDII